MDIPVTPDRASRWQDWANLILGAWLFISPWVFGLAGMPHGMALAFWIFGAIIFIASAFALFVGGMWEEWLNVIAGFLMFLWAFSGNALASVMWNALIIGAAVSLLAIWEVARQRTAPIRRA